MFLPSPCTTAYSCEDLIFPLLFKTLTLILIDISYITATNVIFIMATKCNKYFYMQVYHLPSIRHFISPLIL